MVRACLAGVLLGGYACTEPGTGGEAGEGTAVGDTTIVEAQEALTSSVMALPGVVGTAVGLCSGEPCIKVYLSASDVDLLRRIPDTYQGFKVETEVTGQFRSRDEGDDR